MGKNLSAAHLAWPFLLAVAALIAPAGSASGGSDPLGAGLYHQVRFAGYSPLAGTRALLSRVLAPLAERRALALYVARGQPIPEYTLDLTDEHFTVFVPAEPPPARGYPLLVFIPPWSRADVPARWRGVLEGNGVAWVVAANSGNGQPDLTRRMALALHAYANVAARLPVDPGRVYLGGFSGGARVAAQLALDYPEVFRGAILDGGSDPVGSAHLPLPAPELLDRAQQGLRLAYLFGSADAASVAAAQASIRAARQWCLPAPVRLEMRGHPHEPADARTLQRALRLLETPLGPRAGLAACRARHEAARQAAVAEVDALLVSGQRDEALAALRALDGRFAHYAGAQIERLAARLGY